VARQLDVVDAQGINNLSRQVTEEFGRLDILVNNAAIHYDTWQTATKADIEGIVHESFETNVFGAWRMIEAFVPLMVSHQWGANRQRFERRWVPRLDGRRDASLFDVKSRAQRAHQGRGRRIAHERHPR
jgi:NAD(P)-dependent dehydrogenase (short-subunit alcohol dehydrogenase family)